MKEITLLELFAGIGGFSKGFQDAGYTFKNHYFSEVDKHAIANYKYNYNEAKYIGSVKDVRGNGIERPDVITFGSPCQDFSIAGKQLGLEGQRSSLIMEAIRLINECKPSVFIWENVKGAFSSNDGADFWAIIAAFTNIGGYRLEWQLLNTSWFLPQNRERIYLVGHLANRSEPGIFPITENDKLFNEQSQTNQRFSQTKHITTALKASGKMKADDTFIQLQKVAGTLTAGGNSGGLHSDMTIINVNTKKTEEQFNVISPKDHEPIVRAVLTPDRMDKRQNGRRFKTDGEPAFTLGCQDTPGIMIDSQIRRLTEIECERLQGFPDDWTRFGIYQKQVWINKKLKTFEIVQGVKQIPKTQRYKMLGNAVTTNVVAQIAKKLKLNP